MSLTSLVKPVLLLGLMVVMLSMGLKVKLDEVVASIRMPRLLILSVVANFLLVPAVMMGILQAFDPGPLLSVGFLILAVCPGAPLGPPFATIARGDVPCAIGQMVILAGFSALLSPALLRMVLPHVLPANDLHVDYLAIVRTLLVVQILPLAFGLAIHHGAPKLTGRIARPVRVLADLLLLSAIALVLVKEREAIESFNMRGWFAMLLVLIPSVGIGWLCGGPGQATRKALALTTGLRNVAVALIIVSNNFAGTTAVSAVIAYAFVSIVGTLGCAFLFAVVPREVSWRHH